MTVAGHTDENNLLMAGALYATLTAKAPAIEAEIVFDLDGNATNQLIVRVPFLKSPYRLTVERIED